MEIFLIVGVMALIFWTVGYFIGLNDDTLNNYWAYPLAVVFFVIIFSFWLLITDKTYEEVKIQEAVINDTTIQYYMDNGKMIPVPNHATKVIKIKPRTFSLDPINYKVIYD